MSFIMDIKTIESIGTSDGSGNIHYWNPPPMDGGLALREYHRKFEKVGTIEVRDDEGMVFKLPSFKDSPDINVPYPEWVNNRQEFIFGNALNGHGEECCKDTTNGRQKLPIEMETFLRCLGMTVDSDGFQNFKNNFFFANSEGSKYNCTFANNEQENQFKELTSKRAYSCYYHYAKTILHKQENIEHLYREYMRGYRNACKTRLVDKKGYRHHLLEEFIWITNASLGWQLGSSQTVALCYGLEEAVSLYENGGCGFFKQLEIIYGKEELEDSLGSGSFAQLPQRFGVVDTKRCKSNMEKYAMLARFFREGDEENSDSEMDNDSSTNEEMGEPENQDEPDNVVTDSDNSTDENGTSNQN